MRCKFRDLAISRFRYFSLRFFLDFLYENFMRRVKKLRICDYYFLK
jgi:hypothetical protein